MSSSKDRSPNPSRIFPTYFVVITIFVLSKLPSIYQQLGLNYPLNSSYLLDDAQQVQSRAIQEKFLLISHFAFSTEVRGPLSFLP